MPQALYTDWKNVYVRPPNEAERVTGAEPLTQFGRMCATLGIRIIPASSPQAKGRIERNHGTQQDRLVKKLRRKGMRTSRRANAFLETEYWADHNRPVRAGARVRRTIFTWRGRAGCGSTRCFAWRRRAPSPTTGWCAMHNRLLAARPAEWPRAGAQHRAGLRERGRAAGDSVSRSRDALDGNRRRRGRRRARPSRRRPPRSPRRRRAAAPPRAAADHPWRQGFKQMGRDVPYWQLVTDEEPVEAAGAVDAQTRPPLLGKPQNSFPRAPTGISVTQKGTFLSS